MPKKSAGFIQFIPLLIVAFVAIAVLAFSMEPRPQKNQGKAVLSESDTEGSSTPNPSSTFKPQETEGPRDIFETPEPTETPELELEDEIEVEVKEGTEASRIKIGTMSGKFVFTEKEFGAESDFPISVNKTTRELTITTPQGPKIVSVLPDTAVQNMLAQNVIDRILGTNGQLVQITTDSNGNLVYLISGIKDEKFIGIFSISIPKTLTVSTQTGDLTAVTQDTLSKLLDALSF